MAETIVKIMKAKALLEAPQTRPNALGTLAAALLMASAATLMAGMVVLGPGVQF